MNRKAFQRLALKRLADAEALFRAKRFDASYYLAGYVIECALKACIAKRTRRYDFHDKALANRTYTHDLEVLLKESGHNQELAKDPDFKTNWNVVKDWSEKSRYLEYDWKKADAICSRQSAVRRGVFCDAYKSIGERAH